MQDKVNALASEETEGQVIEQEKLPPHGNSIILMFYNWLSATTGNLLKRPPPPLAIESSKPQGVVEEPAGDCIIAKNETPVDISKAIVAAISDAVNPNIVKLKDCHLSDAFDNFNDKSMADQLKNVLYC